MVAHNVCCNQKLLWQQGCPSLSTKAPVEHEQRGYFSVFVISIFTLHLILTPKPPRQKALAPYNYNKSDKYLDRSCYSPFPPPIGDFRSTFVDVFVQHSRDRTDSDRRFSF